MQFTKMHGTGNDYIYINSLQEKVNFHRPTLAQKISNRHFGVGSDGLIFIEKVSNGLYSMDMYNADGSYSQMCGNGLRCVAKYLFDNQMISQKDFSIQTGGQSFPVQVFLDQKEKVKLVEVNMGEPITDPLKIPVLDSDGRMHILDKVFKFTAISMGNPHCVIFIDEPLADFPLYQYAPLIQKHRIFPQGVNVEFVNIVNRTEVFQRTWERGSGETLACGSGACAVLVAGVLLNHLEKTIVNHLKGGDLFLSWRQEAVFLKGQTVKVFDGCWNTENYFF